MAKRFVVMITHKGKFKEYFVFDNELGDYVQDWTGGIYHWIRFKNRASAQSAANLFNRLYKDFKKLKKQMGNLLDGFVEFKINETSCGEGK